MLSVRRRGKKCRVGGVPSERGERVQVRSCVQPKRVGRERIEGMDL